MKLDKLQPAMFNGILFENGRVFGEKTFGGETVGKLSCRDGWTGAETLLVDPATFKPKGAKEGNVTGSVQRRRPPSSGSLTFASSWPETGFFHMYSTVPLPFFAASTISGPTAFPVESLRVAASFPRIVASVGVGRDLVGRVHAEHVHVVAEAAGRVVELADGLRGAVLLDLGHRLVEERFDRSKQRLDGPGTPGPSA